MDWREAVLQRQRMVETIKGSSHLPGYNFDFWGIPYLIGKGIDESQHRDFCNLAHGILLRELAGEEVDADSEIDRFAAIFTRCT
jgi:p-methyltransferase